MIYDDEHGAAFDEAEEQEIYWDLFCGGKRPRVQHPDEWEMENKRQDDEDKARVGYER